MGFLKNATVSFEARISKAYAKAGDAANETFANIRTVFAYGGAESEVARYDTHLAAAQESGEGKVREVVSFCERRHRGRGRSPRPAPRLRAPQ